MCVFASIHAMQMSKNNFVELILFLSPLHRFLGLNSGYLACRASTFIL